jgi:myo-inositol 2-dehydrogenase/D-chiro-inositol 1-dehydrogenase
MEGMLAACKENNVQLMTAFPCRYLSAVEQAKQAIDRGDIGNVLAIKGTNRGTRPQGWFLDPKLAGGGALLDHTVHVMDLMHWIVGARVREVYAYANTLFHHGIAVDDTGMIHVPFENDTIGCIDTSWSRSQAFPARVDVTLEIVGTDGHISVDGLAQRNEFYSNELGKGIWTYWGEDMDAKLIQGFVQALLGNSTVPITGEDGMRSTAIALAGYESLRTGQPVVV